MNSSEPTPAELPKRTWLRRVLGFVTRRRLAKAAIGGTALVVVGWFGLPWLVPLPESLNDPSSPSPELLARDGSVLATFSRPDLYRHRPVSLEEIPDHLVMATLSAEDKRFREHGGIDLLANCRAIRDNLQADEVVSGASTLTQQLIKLASGTPARTLRNKAVEALQARHLEMLWDKDRILENYFNRLDYGSQRLGPDAAARYYFQRPLDQLSLAQSALLAGLPQAPSRHNPLRNPEQALKRRNWVLDRMQIVFGLDPEEIERAKDEPLDLRPVDETSLAPHLADLFRGKAPEGPLTTTIDPKIQAFAERCVRQELERLATNNAQQAAVLVIDNPTGEILALIGSGGYENENGGQINGVFAPRSPGSTLKPLLYACAFDRKQSWPGHILPDIPDAFLSTDGSRAPRNYDLRYYGPVTARFALANSLNVAAMQQLNEMGGASAWMPFLQSLGMKFEQPAEHYGLGLAIGNAEMPLIAVAQAYQCLANQGRLKTLTLQPQAPTPGENKLSAGAAWMVGHILRDPIARAHAFGLNSPLRLDFPCAVKTGTSSDFRDNWCIGYTPQHTVAVWLGNFDNTPMHGISGVSGAGPIFHEIMSQLGPGTTGTTWPAPPNSLTQLAIDPRTGKRYLTATNGNQKNQKFEWAWSSAPPLPIQNADYHADGKVLLDDRYAGWLSDESNARASQFALARDNRPGAPPRITSPLNGARYVLDPDIPGGTSKITLKTNLTESVQWSCETLAIEPNSNALHLKPGTHQIKAKLSNGTELTSTITVRAL